MVIGLLLPATAFATTYTVRPDGQGIIANIQAGIDRCQDGDELLLVPGTFSGAGNHDIDFHGKAITVRSRDGDPQLVTIDCWDPLGHGRGFHFHSGEGPGAILESVTISRGDRPGGQGGGILCDGASPTIRNCIVEDCYAELGGAICCDNLAAPAITGCVFHDNSGYCAGGISCLHGAAPILTGCLIAGNEATYNWGGGLRTESGAHPVLTECIFTDNYAKSGGAICSGESAVTARNCLFHGNSCWNTIIYNWYSLDDYTECTFAANEPVHQNYPVNVIQVVNGTLDLARSLIAFNSLKPGRNFRCTACDVYGNEHGDWIETLAEQLDVRGNFWAAPCFCDLAGADFRLCADSWCLPANNPWGWGIQVGSLGAGCAACDCNGPVALQEISWGAAKHLYR
jgi:predicted outer membrane repeat protein